MGAVLKPLQKVAGTFLGITPTGKQEQAPVAPSYEEQKRQAEEKLKAQQLAEVGDKKLGLQSTILGGSEADDSVLMKKKLLGE